MYQVHAIPQWPFGSFCTGSGFTYWHSGVKTSSVGVAWSFRRIRCCAASLWVRLMIGSIGGASLALSFVFNFYLLDRMQFLTIDIINFIITGYPRARIMATQTEPSFFGFIKHNPIVSAFAVGSLSAAVLYYMTKTPKPIKVPVRSSLKKRTKTQPATEQNFIKQ